MITPSTNLPRGGLANAEARTTARAEHGSDFREEIARGRDRERDSGRLRAAADARGASSEPDPRVDAREEEAHEPVAADQADAPTDQKSPADATRSEPGATGATGQPTSPAAKASARPAPGAKLESAAAEPDAAAAITPPTTEPPTIIPPVAPGVATGGQTHAPQPAGSARTGPASGSGDAPQAVDPAAGATVRAALGAGPDSTLPSRRVGERDGVELPAESRSAASAEAGSADPAALLRGAMRADDAAPPAPSAPVAPTRLAPAQLPQFLENLQVRVDGAAGSALVELEPPDLGRLTVELSLQPEGGVRAEVRAERRDGYAAVEARLPELRTSLVERGFASADVQLSLGLAQRDARGEPGSAPPRRSARGTVQELAPERVLALAHQRSGSIDVWA